ncbi:unnamed protein product [Paramecium sonneborni]|uniref:EF-hand domain-containing protein n=1 Tax=Paramecium sonneborni TaxID=65129 RepID=A0A8S1REQ2_9CILI|nr:unnamed protein product [Paramecium sonneborni]
MEEILQIVFDLGEQKQETLKVYRDSDPVQLAQDFVNQHNLKNEAIPMIEETIWHHLKQITINKAQQQENIFDRLHKEAQIKQQRKQIEFANQQLSQRVNIPSPVIKYNPGDILYQKGIQHKEQLERLQDQRKMEQSQIEYPFKPFISERSQLIAKRPHKQSMPDYLMQMRKDISKHKEQMRTSRYQIETQECSFRPNINQISQKILMEKSKNSQSNIYDRLYNDGMQSKVKRMSNMENIESQSQSQLLNQQSSRKHSKTEMPFLERMQISVFQQRKKKEAINPQQEYDQSTGQKLYHPQICRPPISRNADHLPIGEYLYQMRTIKEDKFHFLIEQDRQDQQNQRARSLDKSNQIYEIKKKKFIYEIFNLLDSDSDGLISAQKIEISSINSEILQILTPLLCEMEQINAQLNQQQFYEAANRLIQTLPIVDRDKLLKGLSSKQKTQQEEYSFQPKLNQNSMRIVSTRQNHSVSNHKHQIYQKDEMQECTFKPKLYTPLKIYEFMLNQ